MNERAKTRVDILQLKKEKNECGGKGYKLETFFAKLRLSTLIEIVEVG